MPTATVERKVKPINQNLRCNERIRVSPVRLIGDDNEQLGIMPNYEAMRLAREAGLDLVEVAPNVRPPVCRLMNYGKWKYTQKKNVKKQHEQQLKQVRLRPKTDTHDREIKLKKAIKFFLKGDKVQFTMVFRGRERFRREIAFGIFKSILDEFGSKVKVERPPSMDGRHMIMILSAALGAFGDPEEKEANTEKREGPAPQADAKAAEPKAPEPEAAEPKAAEPEATAPEPEPARAQRSE